MRILVNLAPERDMPYDNDYHYHLQGLVYSLIREGRRLDVHDLPRYKFFCFSNIFPYRAAFIKGVAQSLLISSPDPALITCIYQSLKKVKEKGDSTKIGDTYFSISNIQGPFKVKVAPDSAVKVMSSTPIIIRIPKWRYNDYGIASVRPFEHWRNTLPLEAFVKQLKDSMAKKIKDYTTLGLTPRHVGEQSSGEERISTPPHPSEDLLNEYPDDPHLPEIISYRYLKAVSKPITVKGERQQIISSMWEIEFAVQNKNQAHLLEFTIECGFGERNSLGFGFMNIIL